MVGLSRLAGGVLVLALALLPLALDGKPAPPPQALHKPPPTPPTAPAALRIIRDSRPDSKQSRATRDQVVHPEPHVGGGSGGDSRPLQHRAKKGPPNDCFGLKLDRIGTMSSLGCNGASKLGPKPTPGSCL